jgi:hypothetical protein
MTKPKNNLARNKISTTTQKFLDIAEIRDDIVVMRDGTLRAVLIISSINFALKSEDEQNAIISSYVGFLNNIDYPLQIVIQSRELNIDGYLTKLAQKEKEQTNQLLKMQTSEYIQYIKELVSMSRIMNKRFYIVIPYDPLSDKTKGFFARFSDLFKPASVIKMKKDKFEKRKIELIRRVDNVVGGLSSVGLNSVQLDTQGLIELYYSSYNPATALNQELANVNNLRVEY